MTLRIGLVQLNSRDDKNENISKALRFVDEAAEMGADMVVLPEYVDFMGDDTKKVKQAEPIPGPTSEAFARKAKALGVYIHCGSILEVAETDRVYNTSLLIDNTGKIVASYRKIHLYDAEIDGRVSVKESDTVKAGDHIVTADIPFGKVGLTICYDVRFPELFRSLALQGSQVIVVPAAFPAYTGAHHWEALLRARAIENQCYIVASAQMGISPPDRVCYGNSLIVDPWGSVLARAQEKEAVIVQDIDLTYIESVRRSIPCLSHRRPEIYQL